MINNRMNSWLPLLFIPTNASPLFIISFVALTYILHRPCIYCSALLLILFASSCHWSDRCFFDLRGDWFSPRFVSSAGPLDFDHTAVHNATTATGSGNVSSSGLLSPDQMAPAEGLAGYVFEAVNTTTKALAGAAVEEVQRRFAANGTATAAVAAAAAGGQEEWTGVGLEWLRSLLGRREWTIPCVDVKVRL